MLLGMSKQLVYAFQGFYNKETICSNRILKQDFEEKISIVRFHSGVWSGSQENYSTIKKEILAIVFCIQKFQSDVFNKTFLLRVNCKSAKEILQKDVQNLVSKQFFARWQTILSVFFILKLNL